MKIRIKGQSIRFRLTQSDVKNLAKNGELSEYTSFASNTLTYTIRKGSSSDLSADFLANSITLYLSEEMINELATTDRVGFEGNSDSLNLLIEKDFTCLDNTIEDQSDNYPNPLLK